MNLKKIILDFCDKKIDREVTEVANLYDISEYDVFRKSGVINNLRRDFKRYLDEGYIPPQLKMLCREDLKKYGQKNTR